MSKVICNSIGSTPERANCGASKPHNQESCEPCPINKNARCIPYIKPPAHTLQQQIDFIRGARHLVAIGKTIELKEDNSEMLMLIEENLLAIKLLNETLKK